MFLTCSSSSLLEVLGTAPTCTRHHEIYAPWGPHTAVALTSIPYEKLFPSHYNHRTTGSLMGSLAVDAAESAARALWERCRSEAA